MLALSREALLIHHESLRGPLPASSPGKGNLALVFHHFCPLVFTMGEATNNLFLSSVISTFKGNPL